MSRGNIAIWFDPATQWYAPSKGKQGRNQTYSDAAMQCCLMIKSLFRLSLRMVTGFVCLYNHSNHHRPDGPASLSETLQDADLKVINHGLNWIVLRGGIGPDITFLRFFYHSHPSA